MFALFIYEFSEFFEKQAKKVFLIYSALIFLMSFYSFTNPEIFFEVVCFIIIFLSVVISSENNKAKKVKDYFSENKIKPVKLIIGEIAFSFALSLLLILFIIPFFIFGVILSGVGIADIFKISAVYTFTYLTTEKVAGIAFNMKTENKILFVFYFLVTLNILTLFVPYLRILSPFYTIHIILNETNVFYIFYFLMLIILNSVLIFREHQFLKNNYE
jgi:hypothetical protein